MRIVFMGTGDIAIPAFRQLIENMEVVALVTQPDRPVGRKQIISAPEIKTLALEAQIPVFQPESLRDAESIAQLRLFAPDLIVVMAYGQILTQDVIDMAPLGCINAHASLLPRHRGASCVQAAIREGDKESGVTIMHIVKKLDAGDIISQAKVSLDYSENGAMLHDTLSDLTPDLLLDTIKSIQAGTATRTAQDNDLATYAPKLLRHDGKINWNDSAENIERMIRAYDPWPGTYSDYVNRKGRVRNIKIYPPCVVVPDAIGTPGHVLSAGKDGMLIACGQGGLLVDVLQLDGTTKMSVGQMIAGHPNLKDMQFGVDG